MLISRKSEKTQPFEPTIFPTIFPKMCIRDRPCVIRLVQATVIYPGRLRARVIAGGAMRVTANILRRVLWVHNHRRFRMLGRRPKHWCLRTRISRNDLRPRGVFWLR